MMAKQQLEEDAQLVKQRILSLASGQEHNQMVVGADYVRPSLYGSPLPLDDPEGAYAYFQALELIISEALSSGKISRHQEKAERINLPEYLFSLIEAS